MHQIAAQLQMQIAQLADLIFAQTQRLQIRQAAEILNCFDFVLVQQQGFQISRQPDARVDLLQFIVGQIQIVQMRPRFVVACIILVHTIAQQKFVDLRRLRIVPSQLCDCLPYRARVRHIVHRNAEHGQRFEIFECDQIEFEIAGDDVTGADRCILIVEKRCRLRDAFL